jgi:hypothetical protein
MKEPEEFDGPVVNWSYEGDSNRKKKFGFSSNRDLLKSFFTLREGSKPFICGPYNFSLPTIVLRKFVG